MDDHVSKLEHMGKETVKKLQDIKGSAVQSGIDINVPDNRIDKGEGREGLAVVTHTRSTDFKPQYFIWQGAHAAPGKACVLSL